MTQHTRRGWTMAQRREVTDAVNRSPAVSGPLPWRLRFVDGAVEVVRGDWDDESSGNGLGRDRLVSCGAAVATLELALRREGLRFSMQLDPDHGSEVLARVEINGELPASAGERELYAAIHLRHSHRQPFRPLPVDHDLCERIIARHGVTDTQVLRIAEPALGAIARLLTYAAGAVRSDTAYQRDLAAWTMPAVRSELDTLPWALVRTTTHLPDQPTLEQRLREQTTLLVITEDDARVDHLRAGIAMQRVWLAAVANGLAASVHTQSLYLPEVRAGLVEQLGLAGYPHLLMRLGYPA